MLKIEQQHLTLQPVQQEVLFTEPVQQEVQQQESQELPEGVISARTQSDTEDEAEVKDASSSETSSQPQVAQTLLTQPRTQFVFSQPQELIPQRLDLSQFRILGNGRIV